MVLMIIVTPSDPDPANNYTLAELIAHHGHTRYSLSKQLEVKTGSLFQLLAGLPHSIKFAAERVAGRLDERLSIVQAAIEETRRQAALKSPDLLLMPEDLSELRALVNTSSSKLGTDTERSISTTGITQRELSKRSRIALMTISNIENRIRWAAPQTVYALTQGLGLDPKNTDHLERVRHACHFGCRKS